MAATVAGAEADTDQGFLALHTTVDDRPRPAPIEAVSDPRIESILAEVGGGRVLDVGCVQHDPSRMADPNWLHQHLYERADEVIGVDLDAAGVEALRSAGYNVSVADAENLEVAGEYDYIIAGELIEHLGNPGAFLSGCYDALAPGGRLVLTTPNPWAFVHLRRAVRESVTVNPEHTCWFDANTLSQLVARHGFTDIEIEHLPPASGLTRALRPWFTLLGSTQIKLVAERGAD